MHGDMTRMETDWIRYPFYGHPQMEILRQLIKRGGIEAISRGIVKITASSSQISATSDIVVSINKKRVLSEMFTSST